MRARLALTRGVLRGGGARRAVGLTSGLAISLAACSEGVLDPGAGNDPGRGTRRLAVDGAVYAWPRKDQGRASADFDTEVSVRVSLDGRAVTTGTVTVTSAAGKVPLTYGDNRWFATAAGYAEVYILDVMTGADSVTGVRVDGPDIHTFSQPEDGAAIDVSSPLIIGWHREEPAEVAAFRVEPLDWIEIPDSGKYQLAAGQLRSDRSGVREHTLRLARSNHVEPTGAVTGSTWCVTIENQVHVIAPPLPL